MQEIERKDLSTAEKKGKLETHTYMKDRRQIRVALLSVVRKKGEGDKDWRMGELRWFG